MTSPKTTLTRGQWAPVLHRSSAAPHSTLPQRSRSQFLRRDLRARADYFANPSVNATANGMAPGPRNTVVHHVLRGPGTMPSSARYLKR